MTKRREGWVTAVSSVMALAGLCCLVGCPPPRVREVVVDYQEIAIIQVESRFVPSVVTLVAGRPARLHITDASRHAAAGFSVGALDIHVGLKNAALSRIALVTEQVAELDGKTFTCPETGNTGTFRVVTGTDRVPPPTADGVVELSVVMTDDLAAPRSIVLKKGMPARLYITKTTGEEEDDTFLIEAWEISEDIEVGKVTVIELTPTAVGQVTFTGITTPSSRGIIQVVE